MFGCSRDTEILPGHSVMPYDVKKRTPNASTAWVTSGSGSAEPPHEMRRSGLRSTLARSGLISSICSIVVAMCVVVTLVDAIRRSAARASHMACSAWVPPIHVIHNIACASTRWHIGTKWARVSEVPKPNSSSAWCAWQQTFSFDSMTPLGRPVVPLV
eukprot:1223600-Prymnesium_polylepis.1